MSPPDERGAITVTTKDKGDVLNAKKAKLKARAANKMVYRDLVMSTKGISLNIVENAISEELTIGDLKKAWDRLERRWYLKTREDKVEVYTKFLKYKLENTRQRPMDWLTFMEKKQTELMNTGHIMVDETIIMHLLSSSLLQTEYVGAILVINDKLRKGTAEIPEIEQVLEDKYQAMKHAKGWEEEEDDYALLRVPPTKKGPRKHSKDTVDTVDNLDTKHQIVQTRKATKIRARNRKLSKKQHGKRDSKGQGHLNMSRFNVLILEKMGILPMTARKHLILLILLVKVSKRASRNLCWI